MDILTEIIANKHNSQWVNLCMFSLLCPQWNCWSGHSISKVAQPWIYYPWLDSRHINLDNATETECYLLTRSHLKVMPLFALLWIIHAGLGGGENVSKGWPTSEPIHRLSVHIAAHPYRYWLCAMLAGSLVIDYKQNRQQDGPGVRAC